MDDLELKLDLDVRTVEVRACVLCTLDVRETLIVRRTTLRTENVFFVDERDDDAASAAGTRSRKSTVTTRARIRRRGMPAAYTSLHCAPSWRNASRAVALAGFTERIARNCRMEPSRSPSSESRMP